MSFWNKLQDDKVDINEAKGTEGGLYLIPGNYKVEVQRCKMIKTRERHDAFVAEMKVLWTDVESQSLKPGSMPSYFVDMDGKFPELALGNVADFARVGLASLAAKYGKDVPPLEEIPLDTDTMNKITQAKNLLAGTILEVNAFNKPTREGKDFTRLKWKVPVDAKELYAASDSEAA